jgi:hypothetical protein
VFDFCYWILLLVSRTWEPVLTRLLFPLLLMLLIFEKQSRTRTKKMGKLLFSLYLNPLNSSSIKTKLHLTREMLPLEEGKQEPLEEDSFIAGLGTTEEEALIVVVPPSRLGGISIM